MDEVFTMWTTLPLPTMSKSRMMSEGGTMKHIWQWLVMVTGWPFPNGILAPRAVL